MEWKDIESAPKKANILLLYDVIKSDMHIGYYSERSARWLLYHEEGPCEPGSMYRIVLEPTHWMPLPEAPTQ